MKKDTAFAFWSVISFLALVNLFVFDAIILFGSEILQVQFIPDDAYYYLQLSKNFVKYGYWTFDSGLSVASGFHPLLAYLLAWVYKVFQPGLHKFVVVDVALSSILTLCFVSWAWVKIYKQKNTNFLILLTLCVGARSFLLNSVSGVEWIFVVILTSMYGISFYTSADSFSLKAAVKIFALGLLLSLARTDTGLFPFAVFITSLILAAFSLVKDGTALINSLSGLIGAIAGLGLAFLNNYLFTGNFIQSSARMKLFWSQFGGSSFWRIITLPIRGIGFDFYFNDLYKRFYGIPFIFLYMLLALFFLQKRGHNIKLLTLQTHQSWRSLTLFIAALICVVGYIIFYTNDGVVQNWYTANFLLPMFLLGAGTLSYLQKLSRNKVDLALILFSLISLITFSANLFPTYPVALHTPWPHQQFTFEAGKYLSQHALIGRVGAWNSGIIGYYQGGTVVNIDGLVNEDIYRYAIDNSLPTYLEEKGILYIVDFRLMFSPGYRRRGGYDSPAFIQKLQPLIIFDQGQFPDWQFLTIYRIGG